MIFGRIKVVRNHVETHNDDYVLTQVSAVSVRRPFLISTVLIGGLLTAFTAAFADLLLPDEIAVLVATTITLVCFGLWLGNLQLVSRDLRGSDLGTVIWGSYRTLNRKRREIAKAIGHHGLGATP